MFLDLPQLGVEIAEVTGTNDKCEPVSNMTLVQDILKEFGNLTHVVPTVELAGGLIAQLDLGFKEQTAWTPLATTLVGPTACLAFDKKASSYVVASETATATADVKHKGEAVGLRGPFGAGGGGGYLVWQIAVVVLAVGCGGFAVVL